MRTGAMVALLALAAFGVACALDPRIAIAVQRRIAGLTGGKPLAPELAAAPAAVPLGPALAPAPPFAGALGMLAPSTLRNDGPSAIRVADQLTVIR